MSKIRRGMKGRKPRTHRARRPKAEEVIDLGSDKGLRVNKRGRKGTRVFDLGSTKGLKAE